MNTQQKYRIAVLAGDGIGPEVTEQAMKCLNAVASRYDLTFEYCRALVGAAAIDQTGDPLPETTLDSCREADAILFGAIGHPKYDNDPSAKVRPEQGLLRMRKELGLYANLRPVTIYPGLRHLSPLRPDRLKGVDLLIVRELISGIYFGEKGRTNNNRTAFDTCTYHYEEIERIIRLGFAKAMERRKHLTLVDKANVLETSRLWREVMQSLVGDYPEVKVDYLFVDNAAMQLIVNPAQFDVIVTSNMFGDILSDEASVLSGSLGLLPSASIGSKTSVFEPIHGSYPQAAGLDTANPLAAILSAAMLLDELGLHEPATTVRAAVDLILHRKIGTEDLRPETKVGCAEMGGLIAHIIEEKQLPDLREGSRNLSTSTII